MVLEEGKFYVTRDGRKVGPMKMLESGVGCIAESGWIAESGRIESSCDYDWYKDGTYEFGGVHKLDLIEEYKENKPAYLYYDLSLPIGRGKFSFDGSDGTLDTSFTIEPHDMKIIGGYKIENIGSTPIHVSSEEQKTKDDTQMFKVGDVVTHKTLETFSNDKVTAVITHINGREIWLDTGFWSSVENLVLVNDQIVIKEKFIGEQPSSPVQSRKTIVEGEYGNLTIYYKHDQPKTIDNLRIEVTTSKHTAQELREMIRVLGDIVEFLEEAK